MSFEPGMRLGPYQILSAIGAGGMGEIYRARDTRLDRTVAIKVLAGALAADAESRQRFEQEARAIAALNDPHICTIHDVGREGDLDYLVLEYLEGETLAERLRRQPPLTVDETLAIAIQIADALDRAHRAGIVHRDLKPGNVMLTRRAAASGGADGAGSANVKLLDFGLASRTSTGRPHAAETSIATMAPSMMATRAQTASGPLGFSGTVQYMAPEQLEGEGDWRADIFAFGCVVYEMLAGRKAFEGATVMMVMAAVVGSEPPAVPALASAHPLLDHVVRRCLAKDREQRWQSIADVAAELRWIADHPQTPAAAPVRATWPRLGGLGKALVVMVIVLAAALTNVGVRAIRRLGRAPQLPALQLELTTPPTDSPSVVVSPDGSRLVFVANKDREPVLWVRALDAADSRALPGTEGASYPFWAPDGRTVGFFAADKLKRIDVDGGMPIVITDAPNGRGGDWSRDGVILFAPGVSAPIMRVSTRGGAAEAVTTVNAGAGPDHRWPHFLPDGETFLFTSTLGGPATDGVYIGSVGKTPPVRILPGGGAARFVAPGTLLTVRQGTLEAYRFRPAAGNVDGEPTVVAQGFATASSAAVFSTSTTGVLAYRVGVVQHRQLVWVSRRGEVVETLGEPNADLGASPELSPDEQSVVLFDQRSGGNDIWVIDLRRHLPHRITDGPPADAHPLWDPDGQHVVFNSSRFTGSGPTRQGTNGEAAQPLFAGGEMGLALAWTRDRAYVLLRRESAATGADLIARPLAGGGREVPVSQSRYEETEGQFSPDGRWVAFVSNETGRPEVFVQSFPDAHGRTQVSAGGGTQVRWSADGGEIYFVAPDGRLMAVPIALAGGAPDVKAAAALFSTRLATGTNVLGSKPQYAVARDGRFLLNTVVDAPSPPIVVAVNWMRKLAK